MKTIKIQNEFLKKKNRLIKNLENYKKRPEVATILKEIEKRQAAITKHLAICPHKHHISRIGANTGNYDGDNTYWVDVECLDCGGYMHYDSNENPKEYAKYT